MEKEVLDKITRVYKERHAEKTLKGKTLSKPYWYGCYQKDGRQIRVYLGKKLPKELRRLIKRRYRKLGYQIYTWPMPRGMLKGARPTLAIQGPERNED